MATQKPNIAEMQKFIRLGRLNHILCAIKACSEKNLTADKEKIIGTFCFEWGTSRRTLLEYLSVLENAGKIEIKPDGMILK